MKRPRLPIPLSRSSGQLVFCTALLLLVAACKKEARPPSLGEAFSVEQPGGSVAQLVGQGNELPTSATEAFTTAKDGEQRLRIHVLRGAGKTADKLKTESWWSIDGVGPAKAGEPKVMVTFDLDGQGQLTVTAREEDHKLAVKKLEAADKVAPSPLVEPDDQDDAADDPD